MRFRTFFYGLMFRIMEWKCECDLQKAKVRPLRTKRDVHCVQAAYQKEK